MGRTVTLHAVGSLASRRSEEAAEKRATNFPRVAVWKAAQEEDLGPWVQGNLPCKLPIPSRAFGAGRNRNSGHLQECKERNKVEQPFPCFRDWPEKGREETNVPGITVSAGESALWRSHDTTSGWGHRVKAWCVPSWTSSGRDVIAIWRQCQKSKWDWSI